MVHQLTSYFLHGTRELVCYAALFTLLETLWPAAVAQPHWRRESKLDIAYSFLVPILAFPIYYFLLNWCVAGYKLLAPGSFLAKLHVVVSHQSLWVQIPAAIFIADLSGYWRHRLLHTAWLWPFHAIHHSSEEVDWLSNERVHPVESVITSVEQILILMLVGFGPSIVAINALVRRAHSLLEHANLRFSYGPLNYLIVSPRFHRWHHADDVRVAHKNFANFFSCIDLIFGSFFLPQGESAQTFGLFDDRMPAGFWRHMLYPARRFRALIRRRPAAPPSSLPAP
jgi:sterol desaturase/sphingolipid hydroxylase (fatty acid hydroxylase superfamily)